MAVEKGGIQDYQSYGQDHAFESTEGIIQLPVASRTPAHRLIRLHGGYGQRRVKFAATRHGRPPFIPAAVDLPNDTLLHTVVTPTLPRPNEQAGGYDWGVTGEYVYAQNTPRVPGTDPLPVGTFPFTLPVQEALAVAINRAHGQGSQGLAPGQFNTYFTALGNELIDPVSGEYVWPFLVLPPICSTTDMV